MATKSNLGYGNTLSSDNPYLNNTTTNQGLFSMIGGGALDPSQAENILNSAASGAPDESAYDTSGLSGYENYFSQAGDQSDPNMAFALDYAKKQMTGEGPSVAQRQSDLAVANAAANARSTAAGARGGGLGAYQALKAGGAAAGQAAGETAIARAAEQTGALQQYGQLSAADVEQRRSAKSNAAKLHGAVMTTKQAYGAARTEYAQNYTKTLHDVYTEMNGNTPAAMQGAQQTAQTGAALLSTAGTLIAALA